MAKQEEYFIYILASGRNGTLYVGVTNNLIRRVYEHKNNTFGGFTNKYKVHQLVYFERYIDATTASNREKQLKRWDRKWKIDLIEKDNQKWKDLSQEFNPLYLTGSPIKSGIIK